MTWLEIFQPRSRPSQQQQQDVHDREFIKCDEYLKQILGREKIKFSEIPILLKPLLLQPDPIVIHHVVSVDPADAKKQSCYDIMVCYYNFVEHKITVTI